MEKENIFLHQTIGLFLKYFSATYRIIGFYIYSGFDDDKVNLKTLIR